MRRTYLVMVVIVMAALASGPALLSADDTQPIRRIAPPEKLIEPYDPMVDGKPLSYWLKLVRQRDQTMIPLAFDAIRDLGPEAWPAIPDLTRIITAPFSPIRAGKDSEEQIASKLYDVQTRADAIDALVSIGDAAASAAVSLIRWALIVRVTPPPETAEREDQELFIDLITMDVVQRLRVIDAVSAMGDAAMPTVERLLRAPDDDTRKLAVAVMGADAVSMAAELLKSTDCEDRKLGIAILKDLNLIVPHKHLGGLIHTLVCDAD